MGDKTPTLSKTSDDNRNMITVDSPGNLMKIYEIISKKTFRLKVIGKSQIRHMKFNDRMAVIDFTAYEKLFKLTLNNKLVDLFYAALMVDKIYDISNMFVQPSNSTYNGYDTPVEITFNENTLVKDVDDKVVDQNKYQYDFNITDIKDIDGLPEDKLIIVKAKVIEVCSQIKQKMPNGTEVPRQDVVIEDHHEHRITLKCWNSMFKFQADDLLIITNVKIKYYRKVPYLNVTASTMYYRE